MSETWIILTWLGIVTTIGLNGFAAGLAAILSLWRPTTRRVGRTLLASAFSGFLPASIFFPMALTQREFIGGEGPIVAAVAFAVVFVIAAVASLPGAIFMTRKLEKPGNEFRAFE